MGPLRGHQTSPRETQGGAAQGNPYASALALLARRELSAAQLRERLLRKAFAPDAVELALRRLEREGALDDRRAAAVHARRAALVAHRGPLRTEREIAALGIAPAVARAATTEIYAEADTRTVLERALERRLRGPIRDQAQFRRLHRYLLRQGFETHMAVSALRARADTSATPDEGD